MADEFAEFAVTLEGSEEEAGWEQVPGEAPCLPYKRRNAESTPERFRAALAPPRAPPLAVTAAPKVAVMPAAANTRPYPTASYSGGSGPHASRSASTSWRVRSIFMVGSRTAATHVQLQPQSQRQHCGASLPPAGAPPCSQLGLVAGGYAADYGDVSVGPLTQMAAANAPVAAAFCPLCGCFLADVGGEAPWAQHATSCGQSPGAAAEAATGTADGVQEWQQLGTAPYLVAGGPASPGENSWEDAEQDGNWSEQDEASQAAGVAAEAEEAGDDDSGGGEEGLEEMGEEEVGGEADVSGDQREVPGCCGEQAALAAWLEQHGLAKYAEQFVRAGAGLSLLPCLTDQDLQQMGISALGARKKLLLAVDELLEAAEASVAGQAVGEQRAGDEQWEESGQVGTAGAARLAERQQRQQQRQMEERWGSHAHATSSANSSGVGDWRALVAGTGGPVVASSNILQYFKPKGRGKQTMEAAAPNPGCILSYLKGPDGKAPLVAPAAARQGTGRGQGCGKQPQRAHKAVTAEGSGVNGGKRWGCRVAQVLPMRQWQLVPGTSFVVDRFCNLPAQSPHRHWFLTHFHADHYKGLTGRFDRGMLYCSPPTALLIQQQLCVKPSCICAVPLNSPTVVEGVRVTFLDANHCPGAVMILFEPPGHRPVLHTGDCRLIPKMQQEEALAAARGHADLILDTTYCSPEYAFPSQAEVLRFAIDAVKAEAFNPMTLFLFGSYTIGKERLFLEAARVLQRKIYVSVAKRKILNCLGLSEEYRSLLTTDDQETNLHAVPLWMVSQKHMAKLLKHYHGRFSTAVGFQPTGWTHQRDAGQTRARGRRRQKGTIITYQVPYSEHSSFSELRQFVNWFRPVSIIPSVNSDSGGPKAKRLVQLLRG